MILSKNAKLTKLYLWFYDEMEFELPNNLCPYFWKVVGMIFCIIPYTIICIPGIIVNKTTKGGFSRFPVSVMIYLGIFIFFALMTPIYSFFSSVHYPKGTLGHALSIFGGIVWLVIFIIFIWWVTDKFTEKKKDKSPNILVEFVKATYNKYCPKLEWKEDEV